LKKVSVKIALASFIVLILTVLFPDKVGRVSSHLARSLDQFFILCETGIKHLFPGIHLTREMIFAIPFWVLIILLCVTGVNWIVRKRFRKKEERPVELKDVACDVIPPKKADIAKGEEYNREVVVQFFLKIYKIQLGAMKTAPEKFQPVTSINVWPKRVYELSVFHEGDWVSRRLTIGPLGDDGVSKSICYYVIYDDHLVVKIPPEPITDFQEYLACIKADLRIARRLSPKECIIPRVSVILGRLVSHGSKKVDARYLEKRYVDRLSTNAQFQEYLKIGDTFAFFMDLSRYYFLSSVLTEMHDMENAMPQEILRHPHIIWDTYEFEGRYGIENAHIGFEMRNIYDEYEREISRLKIQYGVTKITPTFTIKNWFLIHLSGRGRIESEGDYSKSFFEDLNALSRESMIDNRMSIESYRKVIREFIYTSTIARFKAEMGSIVTNLIGLLIWLGRKQIAMRDLKPDNLLIAGDPGKYPHFLRSPDQFSMGFIDVETSVDYGKDSLEDIIQPQLGGTPKYATPSHLFPNELIISVFGDLKRILHLQDWYAAVAMIFKVITGGTLFEKTATLLPEIKRIMEAPFNDGEQLASIIEYVSRMFWKCSVEEFYEQLEKNRKILNTVHVIVLENDKRSLISQMLREKKILSARIAVKIKDQTLFKSKQNRDFLFHSPPHKITAMRKKCETAGERMLNKKEEIVQFLHEFELLKIQYEQRCSNIDFLKSPRTEIPVATIMEVMFNIVMTAMYTEPWGELIDEGENQRTEGDMAESYEATI